MVLQGLKPFCFGAAYVAAEAATANHRAGRDLQTPRSTNCRAGTQAFVAAAAPRDLPGAMRQSRILNDTPPRCGSGGIGRRTILRGWRRKACGFESHLPHHAILFRYPRVRGTERGLNGRLGLYRDGVTSFDCGFLVYPERMISKINLNPPADFDSVPAHDRDFACRCLLEWGPRG